ncbi:hypothetical protein IQ03_01661 [Gemmobacter caeni]|uniref:Uncharacterized protein n=1 Tax=Gemmobacter caeni TaxID=589035 RepID=A0A2T6B260_9RHOB|nr:hypothetical protein [Gemmobacter caeni]PTX50115.1 hypothetical protein C8N34_106297 [Gemmobacter caeni]TWJ02009.1 hypothetical protein IQ03_01661 [Gemmobacter caeni]
MFVLNLVGLIIKLVFFGSLIFWGYALGWFSTGFFVIVALVIGVPFIFALRAGIRQQAAEEDEARKQREVERELLRQIEDEHLRLLRDEATARRAEEREMPRPVRPRPSASVFAKR